MRVRRRSFSPLFLVFVCFKICGVSSLQTFDREPVSTEVNPNSDTKLDCKVLNKKGSCSWQKDNKPVGIYEKKYEWVNSDPSSGDCSLWIRSATLEFDDGEWECQITASDFTTQDALTSRPVRLIVRVEPQPPRIEYRTSAVLPGHNVTVKAGERASVKCVSRYGNPPAKLKWFLGEEELVAKSNQSNSPEADNRRTWAAVSVVEIAAEKPHNGRMLRCVALHESYPAKSVSVDVRLDVTYSPEVRLVGTPATDVEEGRDHVVLKCLTDSNPPASVIWRRVGKQEIASLEESLQFRPVFRRDSGTYTCQAQNSLGSSQPISAALDVKYAPDIESIRPDRVTTSQLFHPVTFTCAANGNPAPTYEWIQKIPTSIGGEYIEVIRSSESRLHIANITYEHQGEYFCRATNLINGNEKRKTSDGITLQVVGPPHIIRHVGGREIVVMRGEEALLRMVVCADPRPRNSTWLWGSVQVQPGTGVGKYQADDLNQDRREDCYEARLRITDTDMADSRNYYLSVENDRGADKYGVHLAVRGSYQEPLAMATLLTLATGCLLGFLLCVLLAVYVIRSERCCFARKCRGDFRPTDLESEKSDIDSTMGRKTPRIEASMMGNGPMTLPSEAMYCTSPARRPHPQHTILAGNSPEAIKTEEDYEEDDEEEEEEMEDLQRSAKKRKSNSSGRSKRKHKKEPVNVFADLQVPSVSNNGCTMSSLHYYNKSYHKPYSTLDNHHNNSYERNRKVSYDATAYDKKVHDAYERKPAYDKSSYDKSSYDKKLFQNSYEKKSYPNGFDSRIQSYVDPLRSSTHSYESGSNRGSKAFSSTSNLIDTSAYFAKQNHTASSNVARFSHYDNVKNLRASSNNYQPRSFDKAEL